MPYPVAIFSYNRKDYLEKTIQSLQHNKLAKKTKVYFFSDAPKDDCDIASVKKVRDYIDAVDGFYEIEHIKRKINIGMAENISSGINHVLDKHKAIIVLEDDIITAPYFLDFMNDALNLYFNDKKVCQISGYSYLEYLEQEYNLDDTYFIKGSDCLAWGTWKRVWDSYRADSKNLLIEIKNKKLKKTINRNGSYDYFKMLKNNTYGFTKSWAVNFLAQNIIQDRFTLFPLKSLALHIGVDKRATNYSFDGPDALNVRLHCKKIALKKIDVEEKTNTSLAYNKFLRKLRGSLFQRILSRLKAGFK